GRDGARVPLPWSGDAPPYGFTAGGVEPWLPQPAGWAGFAVLAQAEDPMSTWLLTRGALALRRALPHLRGDELHWRDDAPADCLAFDRTTAEPGTADPGTADPATAERATAERATPGAPTSVGAARMTCVTAMGREVTIKLSGRLVLASGPVGYDGATLTLPPDTTAWVAPRAD
ncbi:alpha-amylase, partial [Frankia sp. AiPs1]|nr:alpha-amylase [Frankia sp. AiPs1]